MERYCARRVFFRVRAVDFFGILRLVEFFFGGRDIMHRGLSVFWGIFFKQLGLRRMGIADCVLTRGPCARNKFYFLPKLKTTLPPAF